MGPVHLDAASHVVLAATLSQIALMGLMKKAAKRTTALATSRYERNPRYSLNIHFNIIFIIITNLGR